jgi:2-keto-4-pentenoate hydratase/2-oxohepta-3-ene-1,7-dioic acid hydratase in catechol pathway
MKIICIGRNYLDHAKELGNDAPSEPMFFMKPDSSILPLKHPLYIPEFTKDLHYEVELIVRINRLGKHIQEEHAHKYYDEIGIGIDFTARDLQDKLKAKGHPWEKAKAFDGSAALSKDFVKLSELPNPKEIHFQLFKNGELAQDGLSSSMIFGIGRLISEVSKYMTLKIGDLIYTGTPKGVGPVKIGDRLTCVLEGKEMLRVDIK